MLIKTKMPLGSPLSNIHPHDDDEMYNKYMDNVAKEHPLGDKIVRHVRNTEDRSTTVQAYVVETIVDMVNDSYKLGYEDRSKLIQG